MSEAAAYEAVHVHVASSAIDPAPRRSRRAAYQTITLDKDESAQNILPASTNRKIAFIIGLDGAIVFGNNKGDVGQGVGTTIPQNVAWPIDDDRELYVGPSPALSGSSTARVAVSATYED